jgi:hypothetical protein
MLLPILFPGLLLVQAISAAIVVNFATPQPKYCSYVTIYYDEQLELTLAMTSIANTYDACLAATSTVSTTTSSPSLTTSSSSTSSPTSSLTPLSCPASDGQTYADANGYVHQIECNTDHGGDDIGPETFSAFEECIDSCFSQADHGASQ